MNWLLVSIAALTVASWASTALLVRAALPAPRIGALTDRAFLATIISAFGTVSLLIVFNTDAGLAYFPVEVARVLYRLSVIALLAAAVLWMVLYLTDRLR